MGPANGFAALLQPQRSGVWAYSKRMILYFSMSSPARRQTVLEAYGNHPARR